ncbi:hypothetical protein H5410_064322 [Solanum commersonii]|uniref:Uncharacterized protein n=1 Tax=Solanum commersonii TaxID=4109 RepID=A0A9J5VZR3_SOLCO|nr:hypothetical protein H5410_064322 [Solanum commersonii]
MGLTKFDIHLAPCILTRTNVASRRVRLGMGMPNPSRRDTGRAWVRGACQIRSIRSGYFDQSQEKKLGKKSSVSWPRKVNFFSDKVVMRFGCSMEKNREEAKLTRRERGGRAFFLYKNRGEKKAPWERTKDSESFS